MPRRLLTLHAESASLTRLTKQMDRYSGELGKAGVAAYTESLNEYKFAMRERSSTGPLLKKTGRLRNSWDFEVVGGLGSLQGLRGSVFSHAGYAVIHEEGGIVRPPNSRSWIYLPTIWNLKSNGTAKVSPAKVLANNGKYQRAKHIDKDKLRACKFVSTQMLVDNQGFPVFALVKSASYKAQLGTKEQEPIYTQKLIQRLADKALPPLLEA